MAALWIAVALQLTLLSDSASGSLPVQPPLHARLGAGVCRARCALRSEGVLRLRGRGGKGDLEASPYTDKIRGLDDDWDSDWDGGLKQCQQPRDKWVEMPFPCEVTEGETKHDYCARIRPGGNCQT